MLMWRCHWSSLMMWHMPPISTADVALCHCPRCLHEVTGCVQEEDRVLWMKEIGYSPEVDVDTGICYVFMVFTR
ncbi:hypothetical protein CBR_g29974 [Chara braunii]|uniref:Secreted protein n=1 Tax=Chara braunii TaxID=69332 RepID=A0A388LBL5_CHABU|nr:hypothetical protein CBR_g29974 [Chara braunii]|eukprot:GBG79710.1 hypothetical protein CBR_g29974 [Chara braunii]